MRIRLFRFIVEEFLEPHILQDCSLVIDAQNFFYDAYEESKLCSVFGAECDRYAKYLKHYLSMFKTANIRCYFIFKGGTKNVDKKNCKFLKNNTGQSNQNNSIFTKEINLQVLKEMKFDYFFPQYGSKSDCMTLARRLSCPVLSNDIEYPLSGVQYVSKQSLNYGEDQILRCKLFSHCNFRRTFTLDDNKIALFILLTDEPIFPESSFDIFFQSRRIPTAPRYRNKFLLKWLSKVSEKQLIQDILKTTTIEEELLYKQLNEVKKITKGEINSEVATDYFFNRPKVTDWFISGVAANYISKSYIDVYRSKILLRRQYDIDDFVELSLDIIKYAYDLLTDFNNDGLKCTVLYLDLNTEQSEVIKKAIKKPPCLEDQAIFQTGWDHVVSLGLFQHFILEVVAFDCDKLEKVADDVKMLIITLIYIFRISKLQPNITSFSTEMAYGILLCYVMLGIVMEHIDDVPSDNLVTTSDCESALHSLSDYFDVADASEIMDENLLLALKEFQFCLSEMNRLNKLCGSPFVPTSYRKTYNSTFVYKLIYNMQGEGVVLSVNKTLRSAPTVLRHFHNVIDLYITLLESQ